MSHPFPKTISGENIYITSNNNISITAEGHIYAPFIPLYTSEAFPVRPTLEENIEWLKTL